MDAELLHDAGPMRFHRVQAQPQPVGDLLITLSLRQQVIELTLAIGEQLVAIVHFLLL
jgi:hypothetical protein